MLHAAYLMPLLPLAGFVVLAGAGRRLGDPWAGWLGTATVVGSFVVACVVFAGLVERAAPARSFTQNLFTWIPVGGLQVKAALLVDPLSMTMALFVTGVERAHPPVLDRVHERRPRLPEVLPVPEPVRGLDAAPRPGQQPALHLRRVGGRRGVLVLARRLLVRARQRRQRGQEGLPLQPAGRRGIPHRHVPRLLEDRAPCSTPAIFSHLSAHRRGHGHRHLPAAVRRRGGEVGPAPAVPVAGRRHGGPDAGLRAHPRRHHGHRRRLPDVPHQPHPRPLPRRPAGGGVGRRGHRAAWPPPSVAPSRTSRRCSPTRRCRSSGTCSWPSAPAPTRPPSSSWWRTPSSRRCCSWGRARSSTACTTSRT